MKANELRIGNYVKSNDVNMAPYFIVTASFLKQNENEMSWFIDPIPLTEEWLLKFGFECVYTYDDHHYYLDSKHGFSLDRSFQHLDCEYDIEYVHQLQNLYFALTGKEL